MRRLINPVALSSNTSWTHVTKVTNLAHNRLIWNVEVHGSDTKNSLNWTHPWVSMISTKSCQIPAIFGDAGMQCGGAAVLRNGPLEYPKALLTYKKERIKSRDRGESSESGRISLGQRGVLAGGLGGA